MTQCCSEGYCTHEIVCHGNKATGDICQSSDECISNFCYANQCQVKTLVFPLWVWILIISIAGFFIVVCAFGYCCAKRWNFFNKSQHEHHHIQSILGNDPRNLLLETDTSGSHQLLVQNTSRKFLYNNPRKLPQIPFENKYHATPIMEKQSENFNTYDEQSFTHRSNPHQSYEKKSLGWRSEIYKKGFITSRQRKGKSKYKSASNFENDILDSKAHSTRNKKHSHIGIPEVDEGLFEEEETYSPEFRFLQLKPSPIKTQQDYQENIEEEKLEDQQSENEFIQLIPTKFIEENDIDEKEESKKNR